MNEYIAIKGAKENNLKNIDIDIPKNKLVVITGLSGSGKSSLAFDTIYAEGQRRYVESLSAYARQFLQLQNKPDVESITGLSPAIAIDQKTTSRNPRSTVGTITEIYDYLRLLFARIGIPYSPATGLPIQSQSAEQIVDEILKMPQGEKILLLAPIAKGIKGEHKKELISLRKQGFQRIKIDSIIYDIDELPEIDKNKKHSIEVVVDRITLEEGINSRLTDSVETCLKIGNGLMMVELAGSKDKTIRVFSEKFACPISGFQLDEIEPRIFSFNSPFGACSKCEGLGTELYFDPDLVIADKSLAIKDGAIAPWKIIQSRTQLQILMALAKRYKFSLDWPFEKIDPEVQNIILFGTNGEEIDIALNDGLTEKFITKSFEGVIPNLELKIQNPDAGWIREELIKFQSERKCSHCNGHRLRQESLCIKIDKLNIGEVSNLTIDEVFLWFSTLESKLDNTRRQIGEKIIKELIDRVGFLCNVGLNYLTIARESGTLSGGESQRIRLASQIGSGLCGVLYVLDEPSIGLHQRDNVKLISTLKKLRELGNTVIVVEHDNDTILSADYVVDVGPGAGEHGGHIIAKGTPYEIEQNEASITGQYLSGKKFIPIPAQTRPINPSAVISIKGVETNNLKKISATIPIGLFTCVTGVSGGGKSSFVIHTLFKAATKLIENTKITPGKYESISGLEHLDKVIEIDQSPIGRTPRSNPATYTGAFNVIRDWYVNLPESKVRGYKPGRFSFNVKGGRCETCQGDGVIKIEMHFLPDVYVKCEGCLGARYNKATLEVKYKDQSISDVLNMTVERAHEFFQSIPLIKEKLKALLDVGLGYIKIGQSATTLSGGEAQRVKLAKELARRSTGKTLYIFDEPTTGLHTEDVSRLLKVLHKLVDIGNTVIVIEHNLDVIKTADYVIDIGPEGGDKGGRIMAAGTPQDIIAAKDSETGRFLEKVYNQKCHVIN